MYSEALSRAGLRSRMRFSGKSREVLARRGLGLAARRERERAESQSKARRREHDPAAAHVFGTIYYIGTPCRNYANCPLGYYARSFVLQYIELGYAGDTYIV